MFPGKCNALVPVDAPGAEIMLVTRIIQWGGLEDKTVLVYFGLDDSFISVISKPTTCYSWLR